MKKIIIIIMLIVLGYYLNDLYNIYHYHQLMVKLESVKSISVEAASIKVNVEDNTEWITIIKGVSAILLTYIGIRLTNKFIR